MRPRPSRKWSELLGMFHLALALKINFILNNIFYFLFCPKIFTSNPRLLFTIATANFHGLQLDTSEEDQRQQQKVHSSAGSKHIVAWVGTTRLPCQVPACPASRLCAWPVPLFLGTFVGRLQQLARSLSRPIAPSPLPSFRQPLFGHSNGGRLMGAVGSREVVWHQAWGRGLAHYGCMDLHFRS